MEEGKYYILMADIIRSRNRDGAQLMTEFNKLVQLVGNANPESFLSPMTITLGDEFQSVVKSLSAGIEILIKLEEKQIELGVDMRLRYVLCYGQIDTPLNSQSAHAMLGRGLTRSRELLSRLKKDNKRFYFELEGPDSDRYNKLFFLYSSIIDKWKHADYGIIHAFLFEPDYYKVAERMNKNRGYTWRKERALEIKQYITVKELIIDLTDA
jgi:hypothetical protein